MKVINLKDVAIHCEKCGLAELCLPHSLNSDETRKLDRVIEHKATIDRGEYLFKTGQNDDSIYAVRSGSFKTTLVTKDGEEQILGFYLPGEMLGFDAFSKMRHTCNAMAIETASVCRLPLDKMDKLHDEIPGLHRVIRSIVGDEMSMENKLLLLMGKKKAEEKLATFILSISSRNTKRGFSATSFHLSMSRQDIGNYLGLTIETVSRVLKKLQQQGILAVNKRDVEILQLETLKGMVGSCLGFDNELGHPNSDIG